MRSTAPTRFLSVLFDAVFPPNVLVLLCFLLELSYNGQRVLYGATCTSLCRFQGHVLGVFPPRGVHYRPDDAD